MRLDDSGSSYDLVERPTEKDLQLAVAAGTGAVDKADRLCDVRVPIHAPSQTAVTSATLLWL